MNLIIVESPTKGDTIRKFLGAEYKVLASFGHVRDLPKTKFGVDVEKNFEPKYVIIPKAKKVINLLKKEAEKAKTLILASDPDREGEAIAWHLTQVLNLNGKPYQRIVFHEITKKAIEEALKNPRKIDINLVNAQQARRILDRIVGYELSPFLWKKVAKRLSAGRVQSVVVRLIVEREREIEKFVPQEYWTIVAKLKKQAEIGSLTTEFEAVLVKKDGKIIPKLGIKNKKEVDEILKDLKGAEYKVASIEKKEVKRNPPPPFITSTLQQEAWQRFHFPAKFTMQIAQQLYEKGLCIDENSLIITREGEIYRIKELENSKMNLLIGINERTLQSEFAEVSKFWKIKAPRKMIKIETEDHEKIIITKDHPLLLLKNGLPTWVKGEDIKCGDYVAAMESIPVERKKKPLHLLELIEQFPDSIKQRIEFQFSDPFHSLIRRKTVGKPVPYSLLKNQLKRKRIKVNQIVNYYQGVRVKPKVGWANFNKIPFYLNPKISYFIGLIAGDGHLPKNERKIRLSQKLEYKNPSVLNSLNKLISEVLGRQFKLRFSQKNKGFTINSTFLYYLLQLLGIPTGNKHEKIDIPNVLLSQPDEIVKAYLAGLWDSDGCINKHPTANSIQVSYSSKSELFIDKLRLLLKTFGMNSSKHLDKRNKVFWLRLTSNGISKFKEQIAPYLIIKKDRWEKLYKKYGEIYKNRVISQCQGIPGIAPLLEKSLVEEEFPKQKLSQLVGVDIFNYFGNVKPAHNRLAFIQKPILGKISTFIDTENQLFRRLSTSPIIWKKIITKKEINYKKQFVYDLTTSSNTFIANGLVSHNCTYHRTDSLNISDLALAAAKKFIIKNFGQNYYQFRKFKTKSKVAQEAHEAIRPTYPENTPENLKEKLNKNQFKLYDLIWRRFIACQMASAIFDLTTINIGAKNYTFRATGQTLKFDGFLKVYPVKFEEKELPPLNVNEILKLIKLIPKQHFTEPPPRYTEASLIKELEKNGIGRPSTYAPILATIQERNYVKKDEQKRFFPTEIGILVNDLLVKHFPEIIDISFTAKMEEDLDKIANGQKDYVSVLKEFYQPFKENLGKKYKEVSKEDLIEKTEKKCPKCGAPILIRFGKFGRFYACSNFPKCDFTENLKENNLKIKCPKCKQGEIVERRTKNGKIFYGCSNWPKCDFALWEKPTGEICPKCGSLLVQTKRKQIKCSNKDCDFQKE
jgi:DNA topoisomerase IA